jgi:hypothetical protein
MDGELGGSVREVLELVVAREEERRIGRRLVVATMVSGEAISR